MTFTKENAKALQAKGVEAKAKQKESLWEYIAGGGARQYNEKLGDLADGKELTKPESEFMDRSERLFSYVKAKKTDVTSNDKELQPLLVKFIDAN